MTKPTWTRVLFTLPDADGQTPAPEDDLRRAGYAEYEALLARLDRIEALLRSLGTRLVNDWPEE